MQSWMINSLDVLVVYAEERSVSRGISGHDARTTRKMGQPQILVLSSNPHNFNLNQSLFDILWWHLLIFC